ncbi:MFS transporter [Actinokineospora sp. NPDC004072]
MRSTRERTDVARVIRINAAFQFCFGLLWWLPIFYAYQRAAGLSDSEIFGIQSIYYVAFCLLEIPTGMLADRFDYRRFLGAGALVLLLANLVPVAWPTYAGFLAHFLLIALARSLISGAGSAYLFEYLDRSGARGRYPDAEGKARSASLVGRVVCWPFVGLLMQVEHTLPYWLSAASAAAAVGLALRLPALPEGVRQAPKPVWSALPEAVATLRRSRVLLLLMVQGVAVFTLVRVFQVNLAQPILADKEVPLGVYGAVFAGMTLLESLGAARTRWLRRRVGDRAAVFLLTVVMAACLALVVPVEMVGAVLVLGVFSLVSGLSYPIQRTLVNEAITDSRHRATMLSAESIIDRAVCALVVLALGGYLEAGALGAFLAHTAIATVVLMALVAVALRRVGGNR